MLIMEWLLVLPNIGGTTVIKKTVTNLDTPEAAVSRAHRFWPAVRTASNRSVDGFQVVDQDGRIKAVACFEEVSGLAA